MVGPFLWAPILLALSIAWPLFRQAGFQLSGGAVLWQAVFVVVGLGSSILVARRPRTRRLGIAMAAFNQLTVIGAAAMMMAYVAATSGRPLVDDALLRFDQAIGYEWSAYGRFFVENRMFALIILPAYFTMMLQPFVLIAVLSVAGRTAALEKYVLATFLSLGVTVALFALYPATTAWAHLGISDLELEAYHYLPRTGEGWVRDLLTIRSGGGRVLDGSGSPLIAFPSFHAASGVLYVWAGWRLRRFRPILVLINVPMIAATPIIGGHYLADMVAGAAVAVVAAVLTERLYPTCVLVAVLLRDLGQAARFRPAVEGVGAA